jgi:hypothetical protein
MIIKSVAVNRGGNSLQVISIQHNGLFSIEDLNKLIPIIKKVTHSYVGEVEALLKRLESLSTDDEHLIMKLESQVNHFIKEWHSKIRKLGGVPKGLWYVDFDAGDGFFAWKYPEPEILYWHHYTEAIGKRILLTSHPKYKLYFANSENISV